MVDEGRSRGELLKEIEELRRQEERYRALFDNSPELIYVFDLDGRFLDANSRALSLLGYTRDEIGALTFTDLLQKEDVPRALELTRRIVEDRIADSVQQYLLRTKDGGRVWVEISGVRLVKDGVPYAILGFARDITERKRAEEALRKSEARFRALTESTSDWIWEVDENGIYTYASPKVKEMLGYEPEEVIGKTPFDFMPPEEARRIAPKFRAIVGSREPFTGLDNTNQHRDGRLVVLETSGVPVFDAAGNLRGYRGVDRDITDRKRAEEALRAERDKLVAVFEAMADGVYVVNQQHDIQYVNPSLVRDFGPWEGRRCYEYLHDRREACPWCKNVDVFAGKTVRWEWYSFKNERTYDLIDTPLRNPDGSIHKVEIFRDITERKRAEQEMAAVNERLQHLLRSSTAVIYAAKVSGDYGATFISDNVKGMTGYAPHEFLDSSAFWLEHVHSDDVDRLMSELPRIHEKGHDTYEYRFRIKNGTYIWMRDDMKLHRDAEGTAVEIIGYWSDITDRVRAEEEIKNLARFPSEDPSPVLRVAADGTILHVNPASRPLLDKWKSGEGRPVPEEIGRLVAEAHRSGESHVADIAADDRLFSFVFAPVPGEGYVNMYGRDITEHRKLEEQLRHSQKMEAIGALASGISHEFNNLLTPILGYANLLRLRAQPGDKVFEAADVIERAATRACELTRQLLGFARKGKLRTVTVDMHRMIGEVLGILSRAIDRRIAMTQRLGAEPSCVRGDPGQIEQIIMNLAINARDAMPEGGELTFETGVVDLDEEYCRAHTEVAPGRYLLLSIADTGTGIPEDARDHIFEPFFTTKEVGDGTGMGLATVYGIVKNHGGSVQFYTETGQGTTFKVYLPLCEESVVGRVEPSGGAPTAGKGRILIVDDEETVCEISREMLASLGYEADVVYDGQQAVDYYKKHGSTIDLVLLDMTMPVMDGRECFRRLNEIDPGVKALLSTGHALNGAAQELLDEGMVGFVQKPYTVASLSEAVAKVLRRDKP